MTTPRRTQASDQQPICELDFPSQPGNELAAVRAVLQNIQSYKISATKRERMKTAIAEATMNAMEHGNRFRVEDPVKIQILAGRGQIIIKVMDLGDINTIPEAEIPDIDAKLAGKQSPRGWGLFLIRHMTDEMYVYAEGNFHITELVWNCENETSEHLNG